MPKTILVVDDKASVRMLVREYLTEQGFRIVVAGNGREALYAARHEKPDLILLDIMMPEMDGYEFIRAHRQEATRRSSCSRHGSRRPTRSWGSSSAPMTTSPSHLGCASCWPASVPCCAARRASATATVATASCGAATSCWTAQPAGSR